MTTFTLNQYWTKIASAGDSVDVQTQGVNNVILITASAAPSSSSTDGEVLTTRYGVRTFNLTQDLYARSENVYQALVSVITGIDSVPTGGSGNSATTIADGADAALGSKGDTAALSDSGSASLIALQKRGLGTLTTMLSRLPGITAQDGTDATGITAPNGGIGIRGWLSGIYGALTSTLKVSITQSTLSPTDSAITQQSLVGLVSVGSRVAEPNCLGQWYAQNQSGSNMYLVFYASDGMTHLCTLALGPGAGPGAQGGDASWQNTFGAFRGPMTLFGATGAQASLTRQ